ncbi:50S ribosomal protein L24 [Enterobacteriaceae bacterium ET-AT1-13]|nr:50S ribosomal protein L24 [Enterobacteriaceae bacterium ET-AT1-13]WGS66339.1 50S ribosomal protein L24 [Enterobacteriaceae bacterium Cmel17]WMC17362.1 MAG: 50S ribosomal protein L24 [Enterobacteriaceae bacterium Cmel21]WMC17569.1 MAG: 50S ribosomal protein L24 [Enterobacteriaceae bacterium PSmelAO3-2]WMC17774.1 MAG: 50S ribosomal protein L24 [Enterobacteriaceae bacterium PSmelAO3-1]WMC17977.1 MAG: 50S ribosomal protein L24 [Enterobacteriaceae bacterium PSmelAO1]
MVNKIKKNDTVVIITGKNKGKSGKIIKIISKKKVIIKNMNIFKKHQKSVPSLNKTGGIIKKEFPIHISNISIFNKYTNKSDKVKITFIKNKKVRLYKSNNKIIK